MNIEDFLKLKSEGKTNQQIADLWGVSISTVKRFIKKNNLGTKDKDKDINKEEFIKLYE